MVMQLICSIANAMNRIRYIFYNLLWHTRVKPTDSNFKNSPYRLDAHLARKIESRVTVRKMVSNHHCLMFN